jgi:hypothetical protein
MTDAQRYRMNAVECLSAAERCGPPYRDLTVSIAETWLAMARHEDAIDELLATWSKAAPPCRPFRAGSLFTPDLHGPPFAGPARYPDTEILHPRPLGRKQL